MNTFRLASAVFAVAATSLLGCDAAYRDVSNEARHKERIGQTCTVVASLRAHGVTKKLEGQGKTDYITIWNPGFTGPEVTFIAAIEPGAKIKILDARECTNCPFDDRIDYHVQVSPEPALFAEKPAYLRVESHSPQHLSCSGGGNAA